MPQLQLISGSSNVAAAFDTASALNLYNSQLASDGKTAQYATGTYADGANYAMTGKIAVQAGRNYVFSLPDTYPNVFYQYIWCYAANGSYLGLDKSLSSYPYVGDGAGEGTITVSHFDAGGRHQLHVSLSGDCVVASIDIRFIQNVVHDTEYFTTLAALCQFEEGEVFTYFEAYGSGLYRLREEALPTDYVGLPERVATLETIGSALDTSQAITVIKSGDYYYLRHAWDATYDLVEKIAKRASTDTYDNQLFQFVSLYLIPVATLDASVPATAASVTLKTEADDTAPANFNGTYIGASHGSYFALTVPATGHGKDVTDIGSEWLDGSSHKYYIMRVIDTGNLLLLPENTDAGTGWTFDTSISGTTLTHSAGAAHTDAITITDTPVLTQFKPAVNDKTVAFYANGVTELPANGVYECDFLRVQCSYNILDISSVLDYVVAGRPWATEPAFDDASISPIARVSLSYDFHESGSCTIWESFRPLLDLTLNYLSFTQASNVTIPASGTLWQYVPKVASFSAGGHTYDLAAKQDITGLPDNLNLASATWLSESDPPDRFVQYALTAGAAHYQNFGFAIGYYPGYGDAVPATRASQADSNAGNITTTTKVYPHLASGSSSGYIDSILPQYQTVDAVAWRSVINYANDADATCICWYYVGDDVYLVLDYHANINKAVALPRRLWGRSVSVVEKSANFTLHSNLVTPDGIYVEVTSSYGWALLKLAK